MNQYIRQAQYKKGFANIVVIIIAVLVLAAAGGYFAFKQDFWGENMGRVEKPVIELKVSPLAVEKNGSFLLTWSTQNAVACEASSPTVPDLPFQMNWSGPIELSGSRTYDGVPHDLLFELTCKNSAGDATFAKASITVKSGETSTKSSIKVTFPNGGERLEAGKTYDVRWTNYSGKEPLNVSLQITTPDNKVSTKIIAASVPATSTGSYKWTVTSESSDNKYKIEVYPAGGRELVGRSKDFFTITPPPYLPTTCTDQQEGMPVITSLSSYFGPVGTEVEVRGCNLSGFEGDLDVVFERSDGAKIPLYGGSWHPGYGGAAGKLIKIKVGSYCESGFETGRYSGITKACTTITAMPGVYKVYATPWGKKSNEVRFTVTDETTPIKVYFFNEKIKSTDSCNEVVAAGRIIPKTDKIATAALNELLKGPSNEEKAGGYTTAIPTGSKLNSLVIVNSEARADFNEIMESGGGSCGMAMRTSQIRETLLQFPTVKTVKISIDGRTEDIFQP